MAREKIDSLTSLRFFAAAAIVAYHARGHFGLPTNFLAPFELSQGVSFFFVLSGFILAFVYPKLDQQGDRGKFWLARFARVWPLHFATMLFYVLLVPELVHFSAAKLFANLGLVQAWIPCQSWFFSFNSVSWSISTEAFFYLTFPLLIRNFERTWALKLGASFLLVLLTAALGNALHLPVTSETAVSIHGLMYINPLSRVFEFVLGMTLAFFYRKHLLARQAPLALAFACEVLALTLLYFLTYYTAKISTSLARLPFVQEGGKMWLEHAGVPVLSFALLILVMAWGRGPISRILSSRPLVFLGEISFAMYLLHRLLLHYYWDHFSPEQGTTPIVIYLAFLLSLSFVFWSLVEVPFRKMIVSKSWAVRIRPASALVLASVATGFVCIWNGAPLKNLTLAQADASKNCDITFGDELRLVSAATSEDAAGMHLRLGWQALKKQKLANVVALKLLSEKNAIVRLKDYRQSAREEIVEKGAFFQNDFLVPAQQMQYVQALELSLARPLGDAPHNTVALKLKGSEPAPAGTSAVAGRTSKPVL